MTTFSILCYLFFQELIIALFSSYIQLGIEGGPFNLGTHDLRSGKLEGITPPFTNS